ncbi:3'-5' exonuclease [Magnetococcus sp. PR-3]|uniref:3'-5' exonuclease n=1 Tax=Magnetococcus sp. PR-3 TaxID=3120355 RepID=UPI002FCE11C6
MIKFVHHTVWAFDAEWAPDPLAGRMLYNLSDDLSDAEVMAEMWKQGGATEENPTPYLKTALCRFISIAAVVRRKHKDNTVTLTLMALPEKVEDHTAAYAKEDAVLSRFLQGVGEKKPQLVGYNSISADIKAMIQRGIIRGMHQPKFAHRPNKPWEGVDYFARGGDWHIDLKEQVSGWGQFTPSLHEMATLSGIPGKMDVAGDQVPQMWLDGRLADIVAYNEFDALTTYLLWLRMAHFSGHFDAGDYQNEQNMVRELIEREGAEKPHLLEYLKQWNRLSQMVDG